MLTMDALIYSLIRALPELRRMWLMDAHLYIVVREEYTKSYEQYCEHFAAMVTAERFSELIRF